MSSEVTRLARDYERHILEQSREQPEEQYIRLLGWLGPGLTAELRVQADVPQLGQEVAAFRFTYRRVPCTLHWNYRHTSWVLEMPFGTWQVETPEHLAYQLAIVGGEDGDDA